MSSSPRACGQILLIPLYKIKPNPLRPRLYYNDARANELMRSVAAFGMVEPITVCRGAGECYVIISGERRWRAAKALGMREVPCVLIAATAESALFTGLSNQLCREPLHYFELALCYEKLHRSFGLTYEQTAAKLGLPVAEVLQKTRLLAIPPRLRRPLLENGLGESYARLLLRHPDDQMELLLDRILRERLSLREARAASAELLRGETKQKGSVRACFKDATVFINSIDRVCRAMDAAGVRVSLIRAEDETEVSYRITVQKEISPPPRLPAPELTLLT